MKAELETRGSTEQITALHFSVEISHFSKSFDNFKPFLDPHFICVSRTTTMSLS